MIDLQSSTDNRNIALKEVGIREFSLPIKIGIEEIKPTVAKFSISVSLKEEKRGVHMSRFVEIIEEVDEIKINEIDEILYKISKNLDSNRVVLEIKFPYFVEKKAPISGKKSKLEIDSILIAELDKNISKKSLELSIPVTTLCPCSKEISKHGAHNQRAYVNLRLEGEFDNIEDYVEMVERVVSAPVYPVLKRVDEKYVTELAYENPKFVEDVARDVYLELEKTPLNYFRIEVESLESIHNHNAFAVVEKRN